ncbi:hypothetical protein GGX14DRAFT_634767 [Mycena pura]|uniref:Uncharacterized protein n=1 Tax=Mycena pura TaxID=153505 RepID=A0AAD6VB99_9AGAR|nr:hypothetical protein GGX14DRAFT_634767 [Mycena pura]
MIWCPFTFTSLVLLWLPIGSHATQKTLVLTDSAFEWNLNTLPNPNATGHLIFNTVSSLLQHWPNTRYHNGHTIVPGTIPIGTLLYHGRTDPDVPLTREWASTDPEFARLFCFEFGQCWILTLVTTRPLRVLYFDGSSATKMPDGPMDTQDIFAWGAVMPERATVDWDYRRLHRMCDLGDTLGIDAFVRMQLNFEIMLCNFTDGVQTVSLSRLQFEPRFPHHAYSYILSSTWHDHFPGEPRIQLDLTHAISLYDTALAPSLVSRRYGQDRRAHRVLGIDQRDVEAVAARVRAIPFSSRVSRIDWRTLFQVIRDRYAERLDALHSTLHDASDDSAPRAFRLLQMLLAPYLVHSAVPPPADTNTAWAAPVFRLCATAHTSFAESMNHTFTASEHMLLSATKETIREICRSLVGMWAIGVLELRDSKTISDVVGDQWRVDIDSLLGWLDWDSWIACRPACAFDESCYLPGAPFSMGEWNVSKPRCVRLFEPYSDIGIS